MAIRSFLLMANFFDNPNTDEEQKQRSTSNFIKQAKEYGEGVIQQREENREKYGVPLPDEVYQYLNENVIKDAISPEEEAYKWGTAFKYAQAYGIPLQEAYANTDNFNKALWEDKGVQPYKNWFKSVTDMVVLGNNNCQIGDIGNKIIQATDRNDTEELALLMDQYNAIKAENETLQDSIPRNWAVQALQAGAQSAPFTGYSALAGLFGNFIAPAAGTALAGYTSAYLTAGQEYMDLIEQGATHDTAKKVAIVSGGIQGAIEVALGNVPEFMEAGARATGLTKAVKNTSGFKLGAKSVEKIVNDTSKRFHFGPGKRMLADFIVRYGKNMLEEGSEEVLQEIVSIFGQNFAAATDGYDIPEEDRRGFIESAKEAFKGGVMGAITLGFFPTVVNAAMTTANYVNMQEAAQNIQSEKMFTDEMMKERTDKDGNTYRMADIIPSMNDEDLKDQLHQVWENNAKERDANFANIRSTEEIKETSKAHEGYENAIEDEETGEEVHQDVYRENGKLYTNDVVADDGKTGSFRFGDASKKAKNGYGNIEYTMDEDSNTITINELSVAEHRKGLTAEFYDQFAQEHAGWNIVWDPKSDTATKEMLVENNPRGKNNGLNYYAYSEETNNQTRKYLLNQVEKYVPFKLSANEKTQLIGYVNALSKGSNKVFTELYEEMTGGRNSAGGLNELFGNAENAEEALNKDFHTLTGKEGFIASNAATLTRNMRSVIYVGKNGDFGTLLHEIYHAATPFLSDDIKQQMEAVVGKPMDQWNRADNEVFTRGLEDYLVKGYTDNEKVKPILDELSKIVVQFKHYLDDYAEVNPAIQKVFDQLLETDDSVLSTAEKAVAEHEQELKAKQQMEAGEKLAGPTVETQVQKENTLLKKDSIENLEDQVKATLDETSIPTSVTEKIADIINDPNSTQEEKAAAEQWAADADIDTNTAIYQVVHAAAISKIADLNIAVELAQNLYSAQRLEKQLANNVHEDPVYSAKVIKQATHWEKVNGSWIYETDDSVKEVHLNDGISANVLIGEMNKSPDKLVERTERRNFTLQDIITDETVYKMFPSISRIPFKFHNDSASPKINIKSNGVSINLRRLSAMEKTENGFKSVMGTLMQYLIQEKEGIDFNETLALQEEVYRQFDTLKKLSLQAGVNKILNKSVDIGPLQQALLNVSEDVKSMEALNVARRIMKGSDMSELFAEDLKQTQMFYREGINEVVDELTNPVRISHQESIRDIRDKYEGTERWLKAPNGKDTNLTEEQWLQVRTPQFKKWFGDWENYPETASKVVDENGEPKVVYHGSRVKDKFTEFNPDRGFNINAVYFASNNGVAAHFSGTGKNVRFDETLLPRIDKANTADELLSIYNDELGHEAKLEKTTTTPEEAKKYGVKAGDRYGISDSYNWSPLGSDDEYLEKLRRMVKQEAYTALNGSKYSNGFTYACFLNIKTPEIVEAKGNPYWNVFHNGNYSNTESIAAAAMENRFIDGVIVHDVKETDYENILTDDYIVFNPTQIKSATDNDGDFDPTNADIRYQTTEAEDQRAIDFLYNSNKFDEKEQARIQKNLDKYKNTSWRDLVIHCLNVRADMELLMKGEELPVDSLFNSDKCETYKKVVMQMKDYNEYMEAHPEEKNRKFKKLGDKRISPIHNYFMASSSLIGGNGETKALYNVAGSFVNCDPSEDCVKYCYAVKGRSGMASMVVNRELVNWCIESDPELAAFIIANQYASCGEIAVHHLALRLLDTGDMSEKWLPMIKILNDKGISCSIFSKRPEILQQVDPHKNVILLSLDQSNVEMGKLYPTLPKAYVYSGTEFDNKWLTEHEEEIKRQGGVILFNSDAKDFPMKTVHRTVKGKNKEGYVYKPVKTIDYNAIDIPKWTIGYTCPINAGWKEMGNATAAATFKHWNCAECDKNGQGCSFARDAEHRKQFFATFAEIPQETINETFRQENEFLRIALKQQGLTDTQINELIINQLGLIRNKNLAEYDEGRTNAVSPSSSERNKDSNGYTAGKSRDTTLISHLSDRFNPNEADARYQTAYHGSAADFDRFNVDQYGLSGEGSMSFGYGTYVTGSEEIARDYAERQYNQKFDLTSKKSRAEQLTERIASDEKKLKTLETPEAFFKEKEDSIDDLKNEIELLKAAGKSVEFTENLIKGIDDIYTEENRVMQLKGITASIEQDKKELEEVNKQIKEIEVLGDNAKHHLYTVDIPDNGFIKWDKNVPKSTRTRIVNELYSVLIQGDYAGAERELRYELLPMINTALTGKEIYQDIWTYLGSDKEASQFLNKLGYNGIDYPAGTNFGTPDGEEARNFVIFNDEDAEIVTHIQYQTMDDLYNDARSFENWQDFMENYEMEMAFNIDEPDRFSQVPETADAQWYQSTWEMAKGLKTEESLNKEEVAEQYARDPQEQQALDAMFTTSMDSDPAMLNDFLIRVAEIEAVDLEGPEWQNVADEEDAAERKRIELQQDFIGTQLTHGNWLSNAQRVRGGEELTQGARNRILGLMRSNPRAYRAIYAELMEDPSYAVPEDETMGKQLAGKLKRYKLVSPDEDIERINPERLKKLSDQIDNIEIAQKLKNGTLPMNNDLDNYLKSLRKQIRDAEKQYNELEKETQSDYQRIADAEARDLLRLHDKLLKAKADYDKESDWIAKQINKGLKISRKYNQKAQNLKANYDEIFRKYKDLEAVIRIDATVEQALKRQNDVYKFKHEISKKKEEADAVAETKKLRTQLVKRVLRRVPFDRIDYDYARKVIAIQRMVEPNIMGGVNRWIGTEGPYLRGVVAGVLTDETYKNQILRYLNAQRQTKTLVEFIDKLEELKSMDEFEAWWNTWTLKQRKAAAKFLPKEDWIRDLNLEALAKEREESIDLPIEMVETEGQLEDEDGNKLVDKKTGEPIMGPVWELKASQDIKDEVEEAVGPVIFNNILNRPFAEWTTDEMIDLAKVINDLYKEGRDELKAKLQQKKEAAAEIRRAIEKAVKNTGIVINDDDDDETKKRKQDKINKILGLDNPNLKGTEAGKDKGFMAKVNRLLHGYADANVRRVARLLDNQGEGVNTNMLYWKENEAYNAKQKSINERANKITQYMKDHNIDIDELAKTVTVEGREYTVDELLYFKAAAQDFAVIKDGKKKGQEDYYAPTSKNAVMFGNMFSSRQDMEQKSIWEALNKDMQDRIDNELLTDEEKALQRIGELDTTPGTTAYIYECIQRFNKVINAANQLDKKFQGLLDLIQQDYAQQYERMNKISIEEFNSPVHRVKAYVPLVRLESNGDTNANQVKEDLLATMGGGSEKQAVNKGMTQRRTSQGPLHQKPVQTGIYKTWSNSVERTEHFIAYAPYVRELNRVYKSRDAEYTRRFIESRYGKGMLKYVDDYINEVANPNANKVRNAGDDILRTLRGKTAPAYLAWKASAIIKQGATSPWPYMQFVNPAEYLAASWKCIASRGAMYDAIRQKSVFMAQRVMDPMNDLIDEMAETAMNKWDRGISNFNKKGMAGLEWIDWVCVAPGWLACYEKKYAEVTAQNEQTYRTTKARLQEENAMIDFNSPQYMSQEKIEELAQKAMVDVEKAAVDYADDCTRLCQPSSRSVDISPLFKNSGEAMKAYLQFQTSLNVIWQNLRYDIPYYVANMKKDNIPPAIKKQMFMRITGTILGYTLAGIFMNSIMEGYSNGDDDDDKMQALREAIYYGVTQFTDSIPMIGSAVSNTAEKVITGKSGFISNNTDMTPMVSKVLDIFVQASKGNWLKAAEKTGEGFAMSLGLPVSGTKEILKEAGIDIGDADFTPGVELNEVYGILNNVIPQEDK